jgi:hypothetical protein
VVVLTDLSGELGGMNLTHAGNPYHLVGDAWVSTGQTFASQSGVIIKADGYFKITVNGIIQIDGTLLTSNQAVPAPGNWFGFDIQSWNANSYIKNGSAILYATYGLKFKMGVLG